MTAPTSCIEPANVPVVDLEALSSPDHARRQDANRQIDNALREFGFVQIYNHSIGREKVELAFQWSKRFFSLPAATKQMIAKSESGALDALLGWSASGLEQDRHKMSNAKADISCAAALDMKETLELGNPRSTADLPNPWLPESVFPGFRDFVESWWEDCAELAHILLKSLGEILEISDADYLSRTHENHDVCHLTWNSYTSVPLQSLNAPEAHRLKAHTDLGTLTLVFQDTVGGLEVHDGTSFRPIIPTPGAVVVNVGDMLEQQSNGRWKSALHRVVAPVHLKESNVKEGQQVDASVAHRYSLVWFAAPNPDELITTLPGCEKIGQWEPTMAASRGSYTAREWIEQRVAGGY